MARARDLLTPDLFDAIPTPAPAIPGSFNFQREIAHVMSGALKTCPHDRYEIVARMSRLTGEEVTLNMLNAYTAESRESHTPNLVRSIAFDVATEQKALAEFYVSKLGGRILWGKDTLLAELGRIEQLEQELRARKSGIKHILEKAR